MTNPKEIKSRIDVFVSKADAIWKSLALSYWNFATTGDVKYKEERIQLQIKEHQLYENSSDWDKVKVFYQERRNFEPELRRQIEILYLLFLSNQSTSEENESLARLEADIQEIYTNHRAVVNGKKVSDNEISDILQLSTNEAERREAWEGSKEVGDKTADLIRKIAKLRNQVANRLGFRDHYHFSLICQEIDEEKLLSLFDKLTQLTEKPFKSVKQIIDDRLKKIFKISTEKLSPWHYSDPFFQQVPPVFDTELNSFFKNKNPEALSIKAYDSIGLDVRDILKRSDLYEREGKNQHGFCIRIDRDGDTRILCNLRSNVRWMSTQMHELGHAVYYKYLPQPLPYLLRKCAHTNSTEAIAMLMGRLVHNANWLTDVANINAESVSRIKGELVREQAASMLIFVRWCIVMLHFERALYANPENPDLDQLWWELVEKYQDIPSPEGRNAPDWAAKYHIALSPVYYHNYVLGELTASQLEKWIEREAGEIVGNLLAGKLFTDKFFAYGARYSWNRLLEKATGEPLRPEHFTNQFVEVFS